MALPSYRDREWLYDAYVRKGKSAAQISIECRVSRSTILYWMKKHGIEKRFGDGMKVSDVREAKKYSLIFWIIVALLSLVLGFQSCIEEFKEAFRFMTN
jgi:hypothetical protein